MKQYSMDIYPNQDCSMPKKIYLAIPYTFNPDLSHKIANEVSAKLMAQGNLVFSPISHSHHIADFLPKHIRTDSDWWMAQDLPFVEWADEVHIVTIGHGGHYLIEQSKGVRAEIEHARKHNKPIIEITYYGEE